jgi:putative endonuclease
MRTAAQRHLAFARGHVAEAKALAVLMLKGWRPLARRFAMHGGEIDLIVARGRTIAFVEVKARTQMDLASEAIGAAKRRRFSRAARAWLARNSWAMDRTLRADAVFVAPRRWPKHVEGAFEMEIG